MSKLAIACELSLNDWFDTFPDVIPEAECSKKHEKWKKKLFNKMRDGYYHRFTTKTVKVMLVAAILLVLLLTAFVFPSSRETIMDKFDKHSTYQLTKDNKNSVANEIKVGYIPEGYELDLNYCVGKQIIAKYKSSDGDVFTIFKHSSAAKVGFDTEEFITEEFVVDNIKYTYCQGNDEINNIVWTKNDYVYRVSGAIQKEKLVKIAKSVE